MQGPHGGQTWIHALGHKRLRLPLPHATPRLSPTSKCRRYSAKGSTTATQVGPARGETTVRVSRPHGPEDTADQQAAPPSPSPGRRSAGRRRTSFARPSQQCWRWCATPVAVAGARSLAATPVAGCRDRSPIQCHPLPPTDVQRHPNISRHTSTHLPPSAARMGSPFITAIWQRRVACASIGARSGSPCGDARGRASLTAWARHSGFGSRFLTSPGAREWVNRPTPTCAQGGGGRDGWPMLFARVTCPCCACIFACLVGLRSHQHCGGLRRCVRVVPLMSVQH